MTDFSDRQADRKECRADDDVLARVQSWVLGHGDEAARTAFEGHLRFCATCRAEAERIASLVARIEPQDAAPPKQPTNDEADPSLWNRLRERLQLGSPSESEEPFPSIQSWRSWGPEPSTGARVVPANDEEFRSIGVPGISVRRLHVAEDQSEVTMLVRMESGAAFPSHRHGGLERCLVLSGELHVGDEIARAGDYVGAEAGSLHPVQWTETGCELFITSSTSDELIDS